MRKPWIFVVLFSLVWAFGLPVPLSAQKQTFEADPAKSQVNFTLEATLHAVHGSFRLEHGTIDFARGAGAMSGLVAVDAGSGNSGEASRDKKMTAEELKADRFSAITFAPKSYAGQLATEGGSDIMVSGVFTLLGTAHEITVPMHVQIDHGACTATGSFPVPFVQWGLKDPGTFMLKVSKVVTVSLNLVGSLVPVAP